MSLNYVLKKNTLYGIIKVLMKTLFDFSKSIIPLSKFRQSAKDYLKQLKNAHQPLVLTQNGHSAAIVLSPEDYKKIKYEQEFYKAIAMGERDLEEGNVIDHDKFFEDLLS